MIRRPPRSTLFPTRRSSDLPQLRQAGATLHRGARASHYRGLSCCGAQAPDTQAQQLWLTGPVAPRHVGSSQTRARTRVPCTGRQILNHCATREAPQHILKEKFARRDNRKRMCTVLSLNNESKFSSLILYLVVWSGVPGLALPLALTSCVNLGRP